MRKSEQQAIRKTVENLRQSAISHIQPFYPPIDLMQVIDKTLIMSPDPTPAGSSYMYRYKVKPIEIHWGDTLGTQPTLVSKTGAPQFDAFSISELGNYSSGVYSYGVLPAHLPVGIVPVGIQLLAPVLCWHVRTGNHGKRYYIIINTQAITGLCDGGG